MNRIRPPNQLPPLREVLPAFQALPTRHTQVFALLESVRELARKLQTTEPQPFYSTRQVAAFFGVSQPTVVRVYRELETEGLLARRRSTVTMLAPRERRPRVAVRGVVGIPIWTYGHSHYSDWRLFFMRLEEHLRRHAFVADFIFFQMNDPSRPDYLEKFLAHELDSLIWLYPLPTYTQLMLQLADQGVSITVVVDRRTHFPFPTYSVSWEQAILRTLKTWKTQGVRRIITAGSPPEVTSLEPLVQRAGLELETTVITPPDVLAITRRLAASPTAALVIGEAAWCAGAVTSQEEPFLSLVRSQRLLFLHHIELSQARLAGIHTHFAVINWDKLAGRIADDLASGALRRQATPVIIQAEAHLQTPASNFAQLF